MNADYRLSLDQLIHALHTRWTMLATSLRDGRAPTDRWAADMYREIHLQLSMIAEAIEPLIDDLPAPRLLDEASERALTKYFQQARYVIAAATGEQLC